MLDNPSCYYSKKVCDIALAPENEILNGERETVTGTETEREEERKTDRYIHRDR